MSKLIVEVCEVVQVLPHTNADKLELVIVKGFQCVSQKGQFKVGDRVVYFPPETMLKKELADQLGIVNYLSWQSLKNEKMEAIKDDKGIAIPDYTSGGRTKVVKLRGEPSLGVVFPSPDPSWEVGKDVAEIFGVWKYLPPFREVAADAARDVFQFHKFCEIENMRHFPTAFKDGEEVVVTEKIHGSNCRVGYCEMTFEYGGESKTADIFMAGSMEIRRKIPVRENTDPTKHSEVDFHYATIFDYSKEDVEAKNFYTDTEMLANNRYWFPLSFESVRDMLRYLRRRGNSVVLFGEVFGASIQKPFFYGSPKQMQFRAFAATINGIYLSYDDFVEVCEKYSVKVAPVVYRGPFDLEIIKNLSNGQTTLSDQKQIREGVVVIPAKERTDPKLGRMILKFVGDDYLEAKSSGKVTDYTEQ